MTPPDIIIRSRRPTESNSRLHALWLLLLGKPFAFGCRIVGNTLVGNPAEIACERVQ